MIDCVPDLNDDVMTDHLRYDLDDGVMTDHLRYDLDDGIISDHLHKNPTQT